MLIPGRLVPMIHLSAWPEEEKRNIRQIIRNIEDMNTFLSDLEASVALFSEMVKLRIGNPSHPHAMRWLFIPARDGAMSIYHFRCAIDGAENGIGASPVFRSKLCQKPMKQARKAFKTAFPGFARLRHSIAHAGEASSSPDEFESHPIRGPVTSGSLSLTNSTGGVFMRNVLSGTKFQNTWEGELLEYDVSPTTVGTVEDIAKLYWSGFEDVDYQRPKHAL